MAAHNLRSFGMESQKKKKNWSKLKKSIIQQYVKQVVYKGVDEPAESKFGLISAPHLPFTFILAIFL